MIETPTPQPLKTPGQFWQQWKERRTPETTGQLLTSLQPTLNKGVRQYGNDSPIMRSHAKILALHAAESYNPAQGDLNVHVMSHLQRLQRLSAAASFTPVSDRASTDWAKLQKHELDFREEYGRDPSDAEISDMSGLSQKRIAKIRSVKLPIAEGQFVGEHLPSEKYEIRSAEAWSDYIYHDMGPTDQVIMDCTLGRNGTPKLPVGQIAKRLGLTAGAVSQRSAKIQALLDSRHDISPF